tara:strand:+ start:3447 stop:4244 length:798 start_codon:yes stop_codon:yes gene_type:complete
MTKIIGILNLTLDSFSDGGLYYDLNSAKKHIAEMINHGADVIDIGAESTRSGFSDIGYSEQIRTLEPVIDFINKNYNTSISIDTRSSKVIKHFMNSNISFINDVSSGLNDTEMLKCVAESGCNYIMTHMPKEHKEGNIKKFDNILHELEKFFKERIESCSSVGINQDKLIIDPGIGFGKSGDDNLKIIKNLDFIFNIHKNICIGTSNKRYSSKLFDGVETKEDLKVANLASFAISALEDVTYLRVHDVGITKDTISVIEKTKNIN